MSDIPNPNPITVPATVERVYDKQFCTQLTIDATPGGEWKARFTGFPYDGTEVLRQGPFSVELQDLKALALHDPELAQAMGTVLAVVGKYLVKCKIANKRVVTVANIAEILV